MLIQVWLSCLFSRGDIILQLNQIIDITMHEHVT
jgi:hypothetical protein